MIHYSCDRCHRAIDAQDELRYVVTLEVRAAMEPVDVEEVEDDRDHLVEIQEILERLEDVQSESIGDDIYQKRRYDLCPECFREFAKNPIGREKPLQVGFSAN